MTGTVTATGSPSATATATSTPTATLPPCDPNPVAGCRSSLRGKLLIADRTGTRSDQINWKWEKGDATSITDFGDPVNGGTSYQICVYDEAGGTPQLVLQAHAPAGGTCPSGVPCWALSTRGYIYNNKSYLPDGVVRVLMQPTGSRMAKIQVRGVGANLALPPPADAQHLIAQDTEVTVQLLRNDSSICWESVFPAPAGRSSLAGFKDKYSY